MKAVLNCQVADIDLPGGGIDSNFSISSAEQCQDECRKIEDCVAWTYVPARSECRRKNTEHGFGPYNNIFSGPRQCSGK